MYWLDLKASGRHTACGIVFISLLTMTLTVEAGMNLEKAHQKFDQHMAECTQQLGYDPDQSDSFGDYELAPKEREWRKCVYQGIHKLLVPNTWIPDFYYRIIAEDQLMTDMIDAKQLTRAKRRERLDELVAALERKEAAERKRVQEDLDTTMNQMEELQQQMDRMNEIQQMQMHSMRRSAVGRLR